MQANSTETSNGFANHLEIIPQQDSSAGDNRLLRLQAALSRLSQLRQMLATATIYGEPGLSIDNKAERLEAALNTVIVNYPELERTIAESDDLKPGTKLDDAQKTLVLDHMNLASYLARRYANRGEPLDDLQQVAAIGLMKAAGRFDPDLGFEFSTFATPTIVGEIKRHFRDKTWTIRAPRRIQEVRLRITKVHSELAQTKKRTPTLAEISAELGVDERTVIETMEANQAYSPISLDTHMSTDPDSATIKDSVEHPGNEYDDVESAIRVEELLAHLEPREALIIRARAGLPPYDCQHTQGEIAKMIGISQMHVSRLEAQALRTLSELVNKDDII